MIVANHPTGTLDGLALLYAVSRVRRDVKVVTNRLLTHLEPLSSLFIPVDNINGRTAKTALQQMDHQLQNGGVLIFSRRESLAPDAPGIRDKKWHSGFIKLATGTAPRCSRYGSGRTTARCFMPALCSPTIFLCCC